jgi:hypothetical protein
MRTLRKPKIMLFIMLIFPWLSVPLLGKETFKRFFLAGIFISLVVRMESIVAKKRKWWWFTEKVHPKLIGEFPLIWGPFLIGSMWILKFTYGKLFTYMITNLAIDTLFTYPFVKIMKSQGIGSLVRLKKYQLSILFFFKSLILYGFQFLKEKKKNLT